VQLLGTFQSALRSIVKEDRKTAPAWKEWWEKNRKTFKVPE
jgi:hypothetical protein